MRDELTGNMIAGFTALKSKTYSYLTDDNNKKKHQKTRKCVIKQKFKFEKLPRSKST